MRHETLVDRLRGHAARLPDATALRFLDGDVIAAELGYAALDARIRALAARLQDGHSRGERALLLFPSGVDYVVAFQACLYAGVIAVPAYPPESGRARHGERLAGILRDAEPRFILTVEALRETIAAALPPGTQSRILAVDAVPEGDAALWREETPDPDAIAFLQYTSGSTSAPKGVCVSHANLHANEIAITRGLGMVADDVMVSWLPLYHDMGLIGGLLQPLHLGITSVLMAPKSFVEQPRRWLEAVARYGGTVSGGPDFAYALCADRIADATIDGLDLSGWRVAYSGSEFVRAGTLERFAKRFAPARFAASAFLPCYGLAEATLLVATEARGNGARIGSYDTDRLADGRVADITGTEAASRHVSVGPAVPDHTIRIMRPDGSGEAEADAIGEVWVCGPSVAEGYWRNRAATEAAFVRHAGADWLRTGDLGFLREGALHVTGRIKDMLIVRGQNLYPQDIEAAIEAELEMVRRGRVAAFPVEIDGREGIGVAAEFGRGVVRLVAPEILHRGIAEAVTQQAGEAPAVVVLLNPRGMPLTTSGKLQRSACAAGWANGRLDAFALFVRGRRQDSGTGRADEAADLSATEGLLAEIWRAVLSVTEIGPEDDFFVLGGTSLAAAEAAAALRERAGIACELGDFYAHPTLRAFARLVDERTGAGGPAVPPIRPADRSRKLPLSHAQERLWFLWQMDPAGTAYTVAGAIRLHGALDGDRLLSALDAIVQRHEALRTTFESGEDGATQRIHAAMPVPARREDVSGLHADEQDAALEALSATALAVPFDLTAGPLVRASLIRLSPTLHELLITAHHIVADGVSMGVLLDELGTLYRGIAPSRTPAIHYADYALWQRDWLAAGEGERQLAYWRERLGDAHPVLGLPHDRPRPAEQSHRGDTVALAIAPDLADRLRGLALAERGSVFAVLYATYALLLHRYSGEGDIRVGVPTANRRMQASEGLIGFFVNTLVLRLDIDGTRRFSELLGRAKQVAIDALAHQDLPFERVVETLAPERSLAHNPLFQAKFNYMAAPRGFEAVDGLDVETRILDLAGAHFDLALDVIDGPHGMKASFNYATDLFDRITIERLAEQFHAFLAEAAADPGRRVADFTLREAAAIPTETRAFPAASFLNLFGAALARGPEATAVVDAGGSLTYADLDALSDGVAEALPARGCGPETPVALLVERSNAFVIGLLGILKAGTVALPLDPAWPDGRIRAVLDDAGVPLVLVAGDTAARDPGRPVFALDGLAPAAVKPTLPRPHPAQTAYLIYTSGSTGRPKGVAVPHGALANYVQALLDRIGPEPGAAMAMVSTVAADLGHTVLFGALASGAALHLVPRETAFEAGAFAALMRERAIETLKIVPSHLRGLLRAEPSGDVLPSRLLILGGEAIDPELAAEIRRLRPALRILNHYGPTETTIGVLTHALAPDETAVPIGRPLANMDVHVLDAALAPVPPGVAGELFVGGAGLARGYLGAPALTAERFVPDPFGPPGSRLYRTGDRVRGDRAGAVHFLGRADDQIKLRGYRIEPAEIARVLVAQEGVGEAAVLVQALGETGASALVGYCTPRAGAQPDSATLRDRLAALLPDYMVPAHLVVLERLPLTANGKLDRKALPLPEAGARAEAGVAPANETEQAIADIWAQVLRLDGVGVADNFFELGGDSILSLQVIARLRKRGIKLTPKQIMERQTIRSLAAVAGSVAAKPAAPKPVPPTERVVPLLPIQDRFFAEIGQDRHHWNQALLLRPRARLEAGPLAAALNALVARHESLRCRYSETPEGWHALPGPAAARPDILRHESVSDAQALTALCTAAQTSLDLGAGRLVQALLADLPDGGQRLLIAIHHLAVDGVSWRILLEELHTAYGQAAEGRPVALGAEPTPVALWSEHLRTLAASEALAAELSFWQAQAEGAATALPDDHDPDRPETLADAETLVSTLDAALTTRLLGPAHAAYRTTIDDLLLAALARTLGRWTGRDAVLIEREGHGREDASGAIDLSRSVGWFTSAVPVQLDASGEAGTRLKRVKESLRALPRRGLGHGLLARFGSEAQRAALSALPQPQVTFNYLGRLDADLGPDAPFALAQEDSGPPRSPGAPLPRPLVIDAAVRDGALQLSWRFGRLRHERATIERVAADFADDLRALVEHCTGGAAGLTPSDVPLAGLDQAGLDALLAGASLDPRAVEDIYPLSPTQAGLLFHALHDETARDTYVSQVAVTVEGLDADRLAEAWRAVTRRHAVLRTGIHWRGIDGVGLQVVLSDPPLAIRIEDGHGLDAAALGEIARSERMEGFDLERPSLQRIRLIRLAGSVGGRPRVRLIWTTHHVLTDGWSSARLLAEVLRDAAGHGEVRPPAGRYRDYIAWLGTRDEAASAAFWRDHLAPLDEATLLAETLAPLREHSSETRSVLRLALAGPEAAALRTFAQRERVTPNTLVQGAWALALRKLTGREAVAFGATVAGRPADLPDAQDMLGLFMTTLPVVDAPRPDRRVGDWLRDLQATNLAMREHEHTPLHAIQRHAGRAGQALFDTILVFENYPIDAALTGAGRDAPGLSDLAHASVTNYALTITVFATQDGLDLEFESDPGRIDAAQVQALRTIVARLLAAITADADRPVGSIALADAPERPASLDPGVDGDEPVHAAFARHAASRPEAEALWCEGVSLSYGALDRGANRLAHRLIQQGAGPGTIVAVAMSRSPGLIVTLLAVLKAGAAYLPLEPGNPHARLAHAVADARACLLVTDAASRSRLTDTDACPILVLDEIDLSDESATNPNVALHPDDLAYVIYTSGSTGTPKGVAVAHGPFAMHCAATVPPHGVDTQTRALLFASLAFDAAHEQLWTALTSGGAVVLRDDALWSPERTLAVIAEQHVTHADLPPAYLQELADFASRRGEAPRLDLCAFGGEAMPRAGFELAARALNSRHLLNGYGPTEAVVTPLAWKAKPGARFPGSVAPIGSPVGRRTAYVLDGDGQPVPDGVTGELYLGGYGLAQGYLGRPALTAERFVPDPYGAPGARLYRTGDCACRLADGTHLYRGRGDDQVKIRGHRIEPGEIAARLAGLPGVGQAAVVARESAGGALRLVGYAAPAGGADITLDGAVLRAALASLLPDPMVPSAIVILPALPLTANGKLDRRALPAPETAEAIRVAPRTETETVIAEIWREVLGLPRLGVTDNFFELGGDSLQAIRVVSRLRDRFDRPLSPKDLFDRPSVAELAASLDTDAAPSGTKASRLDALLSSFEDA